MQDDVAQAIIAKDGSPLSMTEHDAIVSEIKSEAAQAHTELLESVDMVFKGMFSIYSPSLLFGCKKASYWAHKLYFRCDIKLGFNR